MDKPLLSLKKRRKWFDRNEQKKGELVN